MKIFESLNEPQEYLQIQMERIALQEYQCELAQAIPVKLRHLQQALDLCKQCQPTIEYLSTTKSYTTSATSNSFNCEEIQKLLDLLEKRLQVILKTLVKLCMLSVNSAGKKSDSDRMVNHYKELFRITLQKRPANTAEDVANGSNNVIKEYALHLASMLRKICDLDTIES